MRAAETHSSNIRDFFVGKIGHRDQLDRVHRQNIRDGGGALLPRGFMSCEVVNKLPPLKRFDLERAMSWSWIFP
eukprot:COSAG05_NODE_4923_length_1325_cov_1.707178_1_plen_73_part_10